MGGVENNSEWWDNFDFDRLDAYHEAKGIGARVELRMKEGFKKAFNDKCIKNNTNMSTELLKGAIKFMQN